MNYLFKKDKKKAFSLVELIIVVGIIGLLSTIAIINTRGAREKAEKMRKLSSQMQAMLYCADHPGFSKISAPNAAGEIKEYRVYCDNRDNMWSETLHTDMNTDYGAGTLDVSNLIGDDQFKWYGLGDNKGDVLTGPYKTSNGTNDCNEVPAEYLHLFPACHACVTLNYAGFAKGWRLPSQRLTGPGVTEDCDTTCAMKHDSGELIYCAPGRQLWDLGMENCSHWDPDDCTAKTINCKPSYDRKAVASSYWSSTQGSTMHAWAVAFDNAGVYNYTKADFPLHVRCFLGQWEE